MPAYHADTVIRRANVITIDPNLPRATAVAMRDGRFIGVGSDADVETLIGPTTRIVELPGKTVLPGFIDAHIHVLNSGIRHVMAADCDLPSIGAIHNALAERVGIIDQGRLAAEGPPGELKRALGSDLIVARLEGDAGLAVEALSGIPSVSAIECHDGEITISASSGASVISAVALRLNESGLAVQELTLRTPTLDDVFLQVTGSRFRSNGAAQISDDEEAN